MRKKIQRAKHSNQGNTILIRLVIVSCLVGVALFLSGSLLKSMLGATRVLGDKVYLAHEGESGSSDSGGSEDSGGSGSSGTDSGSSGGVSGSESSSDSGPGSVQTEAGSTKGVEDWTNVLCTGPDGKQFQTTYKKCKELNDSWHTASQFQVISTQQAEPKPTLSKTPEQTHIEDEANNEATHEVKNNDSEAEFEQESHGIPAEPIEVETKDQTETVNITAKGIKIKLEQKDDGHIVAKAEQEDGTEVELSDDALFHIEDRLAVDHIKIATTSANEFLIQRNHTAAITNFPLSWDLSTNTLIVTTPAGKKVVAVLPDQAIQNLLGSKELNAITLPDRVKTDKTVDLGSILDLATLTHKNGEPVYEITGITSQKLFGLFPVAIEKTVDVSGNTGHVIDSNETPVNKLVDFISF